MSRGSLLPIPTFRELVVFLGIPFRLIPTTSNQDDSRCCSLRDRFLVARRSKQLRCSPKSLEFVEELSSTPPPLLGVGRGEGASLPATAQADQAASPAPPPPTIRT